WSAHPNYGLLATVLGVRPSSPGFRTVRIAPALGPLRHAEGRIPHPLGDIVVHFTREGEHGLRADITLAPGLSGELVWRGAHRPLHEGHQLIQLR
ncbi:MAG TPA: alpha-L-rhamnosidase C-terminal domain-containing protein, partial [Gemmatimonadaceae bacterium]|nr:alpha-L-rhamnosidase C-terminal domain-containing protein [Gemmatimonadaceae bacterium]